MEILLGFVIALAISLTGVGAGSMTTPLLILLLGVPPAAAVGTALTFGAIVKIVSVPAYLWRRHVNFRVLVLLLAGGVPGVIGGALLLSSLKQTPVEAPLYAVLGILIACTAGFHLFRMLRPARSGEKAERTRLLPWVALPIGAEVGFSSAGAGALGSIVLFGFTHLAPAEVVGTDLCFGLAVSLLGSAIHLGAGNYESGLLVKLIVGGIAGALCGSYLAGRIAPRPIKLAVLGMLVVLGVQLALHGQTPVTHLQALLH